MKEIFLLKYFIITVLIVRVKPNVDLHDIEAIPNVTFQSINCVRVNQLLSTENDIHIIICDGCDLLHLQITRTDSGWRKERLTNVTNEGALCIHFRRKHIMDAVFLPADNNACFILYLYGEPTKIKQLSYLLTSDGLITDKKITYFSNSGLGICHGLYSFQRGLYFTVLIADSYAHYTRSWSGRSIRSLNRDSNLTELEIRVLAHPRYFSSDPSSNNIFLITSSNLRKLVIGSDFNIHDEFVYDESGVKVLALTSTNFLIIPFPSRTGIVSINLNLSTHQIKLNQHKFTGLDILRQLQTIFLSTKNQLFYSIPLNITPTTMSPTTMSPKASTLILETSSTTTQIATQNSTFTLTHSLTITEQRVNLKANVNVNIFYGLSAMTAIIVISTIIIATCVVGLRLRTRKGLHQQVSGTGHEIDTRVRESSLDRDNDHIQPIINANNDNDDADSTDGVYEDMTGYSHANNHQNESSVSVHRSAEINESMETGELVIIRPETSSNLTSRQYHPSKLQFSPQKFSLVEKKHVVTSRKGKSKAVPHQRKTTDI